MINLEVLLSQKRSCLYSQHDSELTSMYILFSVQHLHFPAGVQFQETRWRQLHCEWAAHSCVSERERERESNSGAERNK